MTTLDTLNKLSAYSKTLPATEVQIDMYSLLGDPIEVIDPATAKEDIEDFYGTPDKAPAWLHVIAQAQPGKLDQAYAEARVCLAKVLDSFEEVK
jgi:hypothetical protein